MINFWTSSFSRSDIYAYIRNKCGISIPDGLTSERACFKVLFLLWFNLGKDETPVE